MRQQNGGLEGAVRSAVSGAHVGDGHTQRAEGKNITVLEYLVLDTRGAAESEYCEEEIL